ncbi:MAG TPA: nucleoside hydrolase [Paracoccaceae bacterium]|nr:nucleoside hydrolase [Paracoccaceae bacterium]
MRHYIDTDPGLDDAIALLAAFGSPELDIRAITTVAGNIGLAQTTRNALRLVTLAGRPGLPVVPGAPKPLARPGRDEAAIHGPDGIGAVPLPEPACPARAGFAPDWLAASLLASPEPAGILALGPLTNLALLLRDHPASAPCIARIIAMGGTIAEPGNAGPRAEFNLASDPEAAALVFGSNIPVTLVPLDVTRRVRAGRAWIEALQSGPATARTAAALLGRYLDARKDGAETRPLHDPCVILYALAPALFRAERLRLAIDCGPGPDAGALTATPDPDSHVEVLMAVDAPRALALLASLLMATPAPAP